MATAAQACQCCATTGTNNCGLRQRRLSAHSLPLLEMPGSVNAPATHVVYQGGDMNNVEVEGRELFGNFLREEINRERLPGDVDVEQCIMDTPICSTPNFQRANPMWASTGRELREMADAFAKTKERQRIRNEANAVSDISRATSAVADNNNVVFSLIVRVTRQYVLTEIISTAIGIIVISYGIIADNEQDASAAAAARVSSSSDLN